MTPIISNLRITEPSHYRAAAPIFAPAYRSVSVCVDVHKRLSRWHEAGLAAASLRLSSAVRPSVLLHSSVSSGVPRACPSTLFYTGGRTIVYIFEHLGRNKVEKRAERAMTARLRGGDESRRWRWLQSVMCWPSRPRTQLANNARLTTAAE